MSIKYFYLLLFFLVAANSYGQTITVEGIIKEQGSGEPLGYAHVQLIGTDIGTTSDTDGSFVLNIDTTKIKEDSIIISYLGYVTTKIGIPSNKKSVTIELKPSFYELQEFSVTPGENLAWPILRAVIANKKKNDPDFRTNYYCEEYAKIRFDLNHFTEKIKRNILVRPFDYIWDNADTTAYGITYLPVLLVEKLIDHYYQGSPKDKKDYVKAVNTTGLAGPKLMNFVEDLYQAPDFYDDYIVILDKSFPGPLNDNYKNNYKFHLADSSGVGDNKVYKITFHPNQKRDLAFTGEMYIDSTSAALKEISVRFDIRANVNFVRSFWIKQRYEIVDKKNWMLTESDVIGDFTVIENSSDLTGFFGSKNSTFHNYSVDSVIPKNIFKGTEIVVENDSARLRNDQYWKQSRHLDFSKEDSGVFQMAHRLAKDPRFIFRKNLIVAVATGYYPTKYFDIGNFYTFYSHNSIERSRIGHGFKTDEKPGLPLSTTAHIAYGTFDEKWKYNLGAEYGFGKLSKHTMHIGASYSYDIYQLGRSFNNISLDNIFSSFIQLGNIDASRNYSQDINAYFENTWTTGFVTRVNYFHNEVSPTRGTYYMEDDPSGGVLVNPNYYAAGLDVTLKYSWQNKDVRGSFYDKNSFKDVFRKYPDIGIQWKLADKNLFGSEFNFQKIKLSLKQQVRTKKLGYFKYYVEAGRTFGTLPYLYLDIPNGNQLILLDDYEFNLMNFMEYVSDQYLSVHVEQHVEGLILDRVPLVNKLKWRNYLFAKGYFGKLSDENYHSVYIFPTNLQKANDPYYEVGFGIENIFKIGQMEFIWRLTDTKKPDVYYFLVKPSFKLSF